MNELHKLNLKELLPSSIAGDEAIRNICGEIANDKRNSKFGFIVATT